MNSLGMRRGALAVAAAVALSFGLAACVYIVDTVLMPK